MTSFIAPTVVGWSEKAVEEYRGVVAPLRGNFWNKVDDQLTGKFALVYVIIGIGGFSFGLLFNQQFPVLGGIGIGLFILLYLLSTLSSKYKAKPAVWQTMSIGEFLERWPHAATEQPLHEIVTRTKKSEPDAEFLIDYLVKPKAKAADTPDTLVLWSWADPFESAKRWAVLMLQDGREYIEPSMKFEAGAM